MRLALAALLMLALTACGGSDEPAATDPTASASLAQSTETIQAAALHAAVKAYSDAYLTGDGPTAYAILSERCKDRITEAEFSALVDQGGELYGSALPMESFEASISGDTARATYTYSIEAINQTLEPWVLESGKWREDDC